MSERPMTGASDTTSTRWMMSGGKSREGKCWTIGRDGWSAVVQRRKGAPSDARDAITDCALAFMDTFYGTGGEFAGKGLAEQWQKVALFLSGSSGQSYSPAMKTSI